MQMEHRELTVQAADGIELAVRRLGPLGAPATIVYVHGLLTDSNYWTPLTDCLDQRLDGGVAQVVYDQRGHGNSGRPHRRLTTTMHHLVEDLDTVLTHASGSVLLVTHSAGSLLAHAWAERYPHRAAKLSGLVIFNGSAEFPEFASLPKLYRTLPRRLHRWRHGPLDPLSAAAAALLDRRFRRTSTRRGHPRHPTPGTRCDPRVVTDILGAYSHTSLSTEVAEQLRSVPSFVIAAEHDHVVPATQSLRLADKIWADCEIVPGAGHSLPHTDPERASQFILQALDIAYHDAAHDHDWTDPVTTLGDQP